MDHQEEEEEAQARNGAVNGEPAVTQRLYCPSSLDWRFPRNTLLCRLGSEMRKCPLLCGVSVGRSEELGGREEKMVGVEEMCLQLGDVNLMVQHSGRTSKQRS